MKPSPIVGVGLLAFMLLPSSDSLGGALQSAFENARVLHSYPTEGSRIAWVETADNTVAATLRIGDSVSVMHAWDQSGSPLFQVRLDDSALEGGDNGDNMPVRISAVSADGSTFAFTHGYMTMLRDRTGAPLATIGMMSPVASPTGRYWISSSGRGGCEHDFYGLYEANGRQIDLDTLGTGYRDHFFGAFLSDSEVVVQWHNFGAIYSLPGGLLEVALPAERGDHDMGGLVSISPRSTYFAVSGIAQDQIDIVRRDGKFIWSTDTIRSYSGVFDSSESWFALAAEYYAPGFWPGILPMIVSLNDTSQTFSMPPIPAAGYTWTKSTLIPVLSDSVFLWRLGTYEGDQTMILLVDVVDHAILDMATLPGEYVEVKGMRDTYVRIGGEIVSDTSEGGHPYEEFRKTSLDLVQVDIPR